MGPCAVPPRQPRPSLPTLARRLLRTLASHPFHLAVWQTPPLPFLIGKRVDHMAHKRESRPTRPRTHLDALSCSRARDFWPPNRVLARNPPHLKGKGCSRTTKAQIGRIGAGQSTPKGRRSVPERGLVARNRRFPCTRDNRQSAPPPSGKLGAPANSTSALSRPFRHLPAATRKGRSVRRDLPPSPPASRRGAAQRKAGGARREALRRLRFAPGAAAVALRLRLELQCGRGFAADDARFWHRTRRASSRALRSANTAPINSVPRHSSRVSHPCSAHRNPVRIHRSTRPKRVRAAGLALAVKAAPARHPRLAAPPARGLRCHALPPLPRKHPPYRTPRIRREEG